MMMKRLMLAWTLIPKSWHKYQVLKPIIKMEIPSGMLWLGFKLRYPLKINKS